VLIAQLWNINHPNPIQCFAQLCPPTHPIFIVAWFTIGTTMLVYWGVGWCYNKLICTSLVFVGFRIQWIFGCWVGGLWCWGCQVKALLLCPNKALFRYRVYVFLEDEILNVIWILGCNFKVLILFNFLFIYNFFYSTHNMSTNTKNKIKCEKHIFETNHMFVMSHFALMYNELKHVAICNQLKVWKTTIFNPKVCLASPL
jgi:hypothetical protein